MLIAVIFALCVCSVALVLQHSKSSTPSVHMRPENQARLRRIKLISGILRGICKVFFVPPVVGIVGLLWAMASNWGSHYHQGLFSVGIDKYSFPVHDLSVGSRLVLGGYFTALWAAMFLFVFYLHRLLGNYSRGEIFSGNSGKQIRGWGMACVLWGAMKFLWVFVPGAVLPHPAPISINGHIAVMGPEVKVEPGDLWVNGEPVQAHGGDLIVNGLIIVAISWFMDMAVEMREESELTV